MAPFMRQADADESAAKTGRVVNHMEIADWSPHQITRLNRAATNV